MKKVLCQSFLGLVSFSLVCSIQAQTNPSLQPLASFGVNGDGTIRPSDQPWVDSVFNQRGLACDPVTGNLVFVDTHTGSGGSATVQGSILILDGTYGTNITTLDLTGINGGAFADAPVAVADDGVVYVCNQVLNSSTTPFKIYRWDSVASTSPPTVAFSGTITPGQRYGTSMDIRGAGTNTQIIIGSMPQAPSAGTNVVIFTTEDGTNFAATVLGTDATTANFNDGIAFGAGNTFWAKRIGAPLRLMSFDLATSNAVTLLSFASTILGSAYLGPITVDVTNHFLAAIEQTGGLVNGGPDHVWFYDISDSNNPVLLDIKDYPALGPPNPNNATAPMGFLDFGAGRLYSHVINNGIIAYSVADVATPPPTIVSQPPATNRLGVGQTLTAAVLAYPAVSYQWQSNGISIAGATSAVFTLPNVQTNYAAIYSCAVTNAGGSNYVSTQLLVVNPADLFHLNLLWRAGPDDGQPFMNFSGAGNVPNQRSIAYNALSNHLYVVTRGDDAGVASSNYAVFVLNATNGTVLYTLNTNGIPRWAGPAIAGGNGICLVSCGVAEDGAVYVCSLSPDAGAVNAAANPEATPFRVWRWADANSNTEPVMIFKGEPTGLNVTLRWGDTLAVRGSGTNTQILLDMNQAVSGGLYKYAAVLIPTDEFMTNFTSRWLITTNSGGNPGPIGKSLEFEGNNNRIWQKRKGGALTLTAFDLNTPGIELNQIDASTVAVYPGFLNGQQGLGLDLTRNLAAGVFTNGNVTVADFLNLYDISDPAAPLLLGQYSFPKTPRNPNGNFISKTIFAGDLVFSLDANNGLMAFRLATGPLEPPTFVSQPKNLRLILGGSGSLTATTLELATFQWQKDGTDIPGATNSTHTITGAQLADAGSYRVVASTVFAGSATSAVATVKVVLPEDTFSLSPIWSAAINSQPYLNQGAGSTPFQRCLAYNALSNQLYLISRTGGSSGLSVNVLDPETGVKLYELNTAGIAVRAEPPWSADNIILMMMGVADDGAIYAGNVSMANNTATNAEFHLYRWADSDANTAPVLVFSGEPANSAASLRWGDTLHVRGSGTNTEIIIDNQRSGQAQLAAVFIPVDDSMTVFTNRPFVHSYGTFPIGRSIQFGPANTLWQKGYALPLKFSTYDLDSQSSALVDAYDVFSPVLGGLFLDQARSLAAGVDFTGVTDVSPDTLNFYEISDLLSPMLISKHNFPTNHQGNDNHVTHAVFAGNKLWALNANNGILAFTIVGPQLTIVPSGTEVVISWSTNVAGATLQSTPSLSPVFWSNVTNDIVIVGERFTVTDESAVGGQYYRLIK